MQRTHEDKTQLMPHLWHGRELGNLEDMLMFLDETGPVHETYNRLTSRLSEAGLDFVVIGAFSMAVHHFRRATTDVDLCVRPDDLEKFKSQFVGSAFQRVEGRLRRFIDPQTQVTFDLLVSGMLAGRTSRNTEIKFPDPSEAVIIEGMPTVSLPRLIELKLVTWRLKDWADVISLIRANALTESFAEKLNPLVRMAYLECYDQMVEEDKYSPEG
ncbi:MAG: nucleotidyl transferase AbiEii/AbiGii toxin family protein [Planctomycetes bacterium]|nr:nucleotidyl transferase AbiEii/AbiGii toxin family protein [Planctomycetota bacterium]